MIRHANMNDLPQIAKVHTACFPKSFSTQMGQELLQRMYFEYLERTPELFLVAEENNEIVGFSNGYYCEWNNYLREFERANKREFYTKVFMLLLKGNKQAWEKALKVIKGKGKTEIVDMIPEKCIAEVKGDLLSICVLDKYRGKNVSTALLEQFESEIKAKSKKIKMITLSVDPNNLRAISFYEKMGYSQYKVGKTTASYYKVISEEE